MMKTRFLKLTGIVCLALIMSACSIAPPAYDILIRNGNIVDGTGAAAYEADIASVGDEIGKIGDLDPDDAARVSLSLIHI